MVIDTPLMKFCRYVGMVGIIVALWPLAWNLARGDAVDSLPATEMPKMDPAPEWSVERYAESAGLEHRKVFGVAFQTNDIVWVASSDGLYRYDGYLWHRFGREAGLPSEFVRSVTVTRSGEVWVGTDHGAGVFNGTQFDPRGSTAGLAGPSVRRITEGPDGALWFSCDPWPNQSSPAGVTRLFKGIWTHWRQSQGLPSDHIFTISARSNSPVYACTINGLAEFKGDRWETLFRPSVEDKGAPPWQVAVSRSGVGVGLITRSRYVLLVSGGQSRRIPLRLKNLAGEELNPSGGNLGNCLVAESSTGDVYALIQAPEGTVIGRWEDGYFQQVSPAIMGEWEWPEDFRMAPDGSFWVATYGVLNRWVPGALGWHRYPIFARCRLIDHQQRVWLSADKGAIVIDNGKLRSLEGFGPYLRLDGTGIVWGWGEGHPLRASFAPGAPVPVALTGLTNIDQFQTDIRGRAWFAGTTSNGIAGIAIFDQGRWERLDLTALGEYRLVQLRADRRGGAWGLLTQQDKIAVAHLDGHTVSLYPLIGTGFGDVLEMTIAPDDTVWFQTVSTLFQWQPTRPVPREDTRIHGGAILALPHPSHIGFVFDSMGGGINGYGFLIDGNWRIVPANVAEAPSDNLVLGQRQATGAPLHLLFNDAIARIDPMWVYLPHLVSLPPGVNASSVVAGTNNDLWVGTPRGLIHRNPSHRPPQTWIQSVEHDGEVGHRLPIRARAVQWQLPGLTPNHSLFSWRWDDGPWVDEQPLPDNGIPISGVGSGRHRLQLVSIDADGNRETVPNEISVRIIGLPIQDQSWFAPTVALGFIAVALLAVTTARASMTLSQQKARLEQLVADRTRQLSAQMDAARRLAVEASESNRLKSEFLATVSHELRTPMNGFVGFAHLLGETRLDREQRGYLELLQKSAKDAMDLIERILGFERIRRGDTNPARAPMDIVGLCRHVMKELKPSADRKHLALALDLSVPPPPDLRGDSEMSKQVLHELIGNAIKFSNKGQVTVVLGADHSKELRVSVHDTGDGIPEHQLRALFTPFSQGDGAQDRTATGLGLGLAMCRELVNAMGGRIGCESKPGQGSTFWFTIPRQ